MALESATYISGLNSSNPASGDAVSFGDDHIRLCKSTILASFPSVDQAVQCIHVKASAPTTNVAAGLLWFDSASNVLKLRNEANDAWVTLPLSPETSYKIMGSATVGWTLPTADGTSGQLLKTNGAGALDWATDSDVGRVIAVTHAVQTNSSTLRSDTYVDTGWSITHNKVSASSYLLIHVDGLNNVFSSWDGGSNHQYTYIKLANTSGTLITNTTDNLLVGDVKDDGHSVSSSAEHGFGFSYTWKVLAADCPTATTGNNTFDIWSKQPTASAGGTTFMSGTMFVQEIKV